MGHSDYDEWILIFITWYPKRKSRVPDKRARNGRGQKLLYCTCRGKHMPKFER